MSGNTNESKAKKVISAEQRERMNAGRKRAMEERKLKKEAEKVQLKKEVKAMEKEKKKELDKELAALKQQKDSMETKKKTMEHRKEFRTRIRTKSQAQEEQLEPQAQAQAEQPKQHEEQPDRNVTFDIEDKEVIENLLQRSPSPQPVEPHHGLNEEKIFKSQVAALSHNAKPETKKFFKQVTDTYDNKLSITDNLRSMSDELKKLISSNVKQIKENNEVIEAAEAKEDVIDKTLEEVKVEHKYKSQLASLMRLR